MPRKNRFAPPGYWLYITQRGNDRQRVFLSDADRQYFLDLLAARSQKSVAPPTFPYLSVPLPPGRWPQNSGSANFPRRERWRKTFPSASGNSAFRNSPSPWNTASERACFPADIAIPSTAC